MGSPIAIPIGIENIVKAKNPARVLSLLSGKGLLMIFVPK
jgi:hypothetical protein